MELTLELMVSVTACRRGSFSRRIGRCRLGWRPAERVTTAASRELPVFWSS